MQNGWKLCTIYRISYRTIEPNMIIAAYAEFQIQHNCIVQQIQLHPLPVHMSLSIPNRHYIDTGRWSIQPGRSPLVAHPVRVRSTELTRCMRNIGSYTGNVVGTGSSKARCHIVSHTVSQHWAQITLNSSRTRRQPAQAPARCSILHVLCTLVSENVNSQSYTIVPKHQQQALAGPPALTFPPIVATPFHSLYLYVVIKMSYMYDSLFVSPRSATIAPHSAKMQIVCHSDDGSACLGCGIVFFFFVPLSLSYIFSCVVPF